MAITVNYLYQTTRMLICRGRAGVPSSSRKSEVDLNYPVSLTDAVSASVPLVWDPDRVLPRENIVQITNDLF